MNEDYAKKLTQVGRRGICSTIVTDGIQMDQRPVCDRHHRLYKQLNNGPKEYLGYQTPAHVFFKSGVTLQT